MSIKVPLSSRILSTAISSYNGVSRRVAAPDSRPTHPNEPMIKSKPLPAIERLREVFRVDSEGKLYWKAKPHNKANNIEIGREITSKNIDGYYKVTLGGKTYPAHRIVWALTNNADPGEFSIDHINGIVSDNRPENLRLATPKQNAQNRISSVVSSTGQQYIVYVPSLSKPRPYRVTVRGCYMGHFATLENAVAARDQKVKELQLTGDLFDPETCRKSQAPTVPV